MLLPHEINIRNKTFSRALNGYSQSEVNTFLDYVAGKYEELYSENIELSGKLDAVQGELDKYQKDEEKREAEIKKLLFDAQRVAAAIIAEAEEKAQKIIADAENAPKEKLLAPAINQTINESELSRLYIEADVFRAQLISMYEARLRELKSEAFAPAAGDTIINTMAVSIHTDPGTDTDDDVNINDDNDVIDTPEDVTSEENETNKDIETDESASDEAVAEFSEDNTEQRSVEQDSSEQGPDELLSQDISADNTDGAYIQSYNETQLNEEESELAEDNDVPATDALDADFADSGDESEIEEVLCINGSADTDYSELTTSPYERPEGQVSAYDLYSADSIDDEDDEIDDNLPEDFTATDESESVSADTEGESSLNDTDSFEFVIVEDISQTVPPVPTAQVGTKTGLDIPDIKDKTAASDTSVDAYENAGTDKGTDEVVSTGDRYSSGSDNENNSSSEYTDTSFDDFTLDFLSQGADDSFATDDDYDYKEDESEDVKSSAADEEDIDASYTDDAVDIIEDDINDVGSAGKAENGKESGDEGIDGENNGINDQLNGENDSDNKDISNAPPAMTDTSNVRRVYRIRRSFKYPRRYIDAANSSVENIAVSNSAADDDDLIEQLKQRYPESKQPADSSVSINKSFDEYDLLFGKK